MNYRIKITMDPLLPPTTFNNKKQYAKYNHRNISCIIQKNFIQFI